MPQTETLPGWKLTMMLADSAQAINGKLYILGGGWDSVQPVPMMMSLAVLVGVPWAETNRKHRLVLSLVTGDGTPHRIQTPAGMQPIEVRSEFEVGRPPGVQHGSSLIVPLAIMTGPLQFAVGAYEWICRIDDESRDDWRLPFYCRTLLGQQMGFQPPQP